MAVGQGVAGVYFIQAGENGPVKIGYSENVPERLRTLQTWHYEQLRLLGVRRGPRSLEARIHAKLGEHLVARDWYEPVDEVFAAMGQRDPLPAPVSSALALRERTGLSRAAVASDLGISERTLYRLETNPELPYRWVLALSTYYGVPPSDLTNQEAAV